MNLSHYSIIDKIGEGGMASVYSAEDKKFDTTVAIKVLNKELCSNENIRKRFLSEAKSLYKMSHANIVKVTDLIEEADTVAFVMEYIDGETLKQYIEKRGKLSNEEIKDLFSQMLDAVGYVHDQKMVHRDIKPSNFMIDKKGRVKLMDFGIAKNLDPTSAEYTITHTSQQMGTPMYMSPEQIKETKSVTAQTDVYSLGVVLWQMVTGQKPYDMKAISNFQLQTLIVQEPLDMTNTHWDNIIQIATVKDADKRFENCEYFKSALTNANSSVEETIAVDIPDSTVIDRINGNGNHDLTATEDLHVDYFFPLKVKDCFTSIFNEMQLEFKNGIDWEVPLDQIDYYNWYYPESMQYDFGIVGFRKNHLDFYFAYYSIYESNKFDYDFVFPTELGWVYFADVNGVENSDLIQNVLSNKSDNDLIKFILEIILRFKMTDCYAKISEYKKLCDHNKIKFGTLEDFFTQWYNATDVNTKSLIKWDVSANPWDDIADWKSHIAFQHKEYIFCIGRYKKFGWSIGVDSKTDLKIYSLLSLVKDNMKVFEHTYSLPKQLVEFIFNVTRMCVEFFGIKNKEEVEVENDESTQLHKLQFDITIFNQLINKYQIKKSSKLFLYPEINEKKASNFITKFQNLLSPTIKEYSFLLLHDDTLFGKCDEGFAILLGDEGKLFILISEDNNPLHISTINFDHHIFPRVIDINVKGVFNTGVELIFSNSNTVSCRTLIGNTSSNFKNFAKHLILIFNTHDR